MCVSAGSLGEPSSSSAHRPALTPWTTSEHYSHDAELSNLIPHSKTSLHASTNKSTLQNRIDGITLLTIYSGRNWRLDLIYFLKVHSLIAHRTWQVLIVFQLRDRDELTNDWLSLGSIEFACCFLTKHFH